MEEEEQIPAKVVLLGESGVGKTSIISQFTVNKFNPRCPTSVSAQFISKKLSFPKYSKTVKFDIWDTVGQEKYRSLAKIFYKDARVIIFVYDITNESSFTAIKDFWFKETNENANNEPILALVANKSDLYKDEEVDINKAKAYADEINAIFQSTSALSNMGIDKLFFNLGNKILNPNFDYKNYKEEEHADIKKLDNNKNNKDKNKNKENNEDDNYNSERKITLKRGKDDKKEKKCC